MTNALRERVARAIAKVDFLRDQHSGFIGQSQTFGDDWIGSVHYEMADAAIVEMVEELEAAVAAEREAVELDFGKLGWGRAEKSGMNLQSATPFGHYYIAAKPDSVWLWWRPASGPAHHGSANSEQDAMRQCQQDYEWRLSQAVAIRARGDTDALAARDARIREEALREAVEVIQVARGRQGATAYPQADDACDFGFEYAADEVKSLITEDQNDE